jgi:hypothetical protein
MSMSLEDFYKMIQGASAGPQSGVPQTGNQVGAPPQQPIQVAPAPTAQATQQPQPLLQTLALQGQPQAAQNNGGLLNNLFKLPGMQQIGSMIGSGANSGISALASLFGG